MNAVAPQALGSAFARQRDNSAETARERIYESYADEDKGDEIGPGCYVLTSGFAEIKYITGQPGISEHFAHLTATEICWQKGKSFWVRYALRRCLSEKKPVMWCRDSESTLFLLGGVHQAPERTLSTKFETRWPTLTSPGLVSRPSHCR
ncbi:hypothetical protein EDB89DRAFT_1584383 [Lactarius sanguifluus]|nr:hypothetical protein EDB89DRAFT_1584383 [Lactarius sanguifluus]